MAKTLSTMLELGTSLPKFNLKSTQGENHAFPQESKDKPVLVMFICNHCPYVIHVIDSLVSLVKGFQSQGVVTIAISSNDIENYPADDPKKMAALATDKKFTFPYLFDEDQSVAKTFRAACTPEFYLFDKDHKLVYRGQMDASRPGNGIPVTGKDLTGAVEKLLAGQAISQEQIPSMGCNIKWKPGNAPDYF